MATRYRVVRQTVRYGKQTYHKGEFLPESFTERDIYKILYPSRLEKVEVATENTIPEAAPQVTKSQTSVQGVVNAVKTPAAPIKNTGASLGGKTVIKK